ncbi:hypothetical protein [Wolbachia pipientis]|uniref:hypothetical protein n=1 Tax=Wolbachia pipientis TaxID=955 RepID=UPI00202DFDC2|nr:hypothetical protein [Wolbachia pipientis]MCM1002539.1 hypothetical protein [Wolbachia pipientis]
MTEGGDTWIARKRDAEMKKKTTWKRHYKVTLDSSVKHSAAFTCVSPKNSLP